MVFSGSLLAAAPVALLAGFISFVSLCVLALVLGSLGGLVLVTGLWTRWAGWLQGLLDGFTTVV